jgi:hypothetical protein
MPGARSISGAASVTIFSAAAVACARRPIMLAAKARKS